MHVVDDRQIDACLAAKLMSRAAGPNSFCDHRHSRQNLIQVAAFAQLNADEAITREVACCRQNKVAQTGETAQRAWVAAHGYRKTCNFSQTSGDQRGGDVAPQSQSAAY